MRRARAAYPALNAAAEDLAVVEAICQRVDRLPLAIELAAVWAKILPLPMLLERLFSRLEMLTGGRRDAPERQRTLRDTIAWSEQLLGSSERQLFGRLAIFMDGCTAEAAEAVCGAARESTAEAGEAGSGTVLEDLARLVEKSLLRAELLPDGTRFTMLETIREYAWERLAASGEEQLLRRRHATYYAQLAQELGWVGPDQDTRDPRLERELANVRAALTWACAQCEQEIGLRLGTALGRFWYSRGSFDEGESWLRAMLALEATVGVQVAPPALRVMAFYFRTLYALDRHDIDRAAAMALEGLEIARRHDDMAGAGNLLTELGHVAEARGDLDAARALFEESLAHLEVGGNRGALGRVLSSLGNLARTTGDYEQARRYLEQALDWARERHFSWAIASGLMSLGHVACEQGAFAHAATLYRESLGLYRTMRNPAALARCLEGVAVVAGASGEHERAARLCGAISGLREAGRVAPPGEEWPPFAQALAATRQALGDERFASARRAGASLALEQVIGYALAGLSRRKR